MKLPRMAPGDGAETIVSFEVEHQIMQALNGPHVPRLVAVGDLATTPYLVMEHVPGHTLDHWLQRVTQGQPLSAETLGALGAGLVTAKFSRDQEREADELGIRAMAQAGYNPQGAAGDADLGLARAEHAPRRTALVGQGGIR